MFDCNDDFDFADTELTGLYSGSVCSEDAVAFPFPFTTKTVKGETMRVYANNEELRDWLNCGLSEGAIRFPVDRRGYGEVVGSYEAWVVCEVLVGALRSVLTTGDNTRPMEPAKAWALLRTLTKIDRDSVRRHSDANHIAISGRMLSDAAVDWQVKSLRAAGGALWELKARGLRFPEEAIESHTDGKALHVWGEVDKETGEVELLRVVDWSEVMTDDQKRLAQWENSMPPTEAKRVTVGRSKLPRLTDSQAKRVTSIKAKAQRIEQKRHKANRKAAEEAYSVPVWLSGYDNDMRLGRDTDRIGGGL